MTARTRATSYGSAILFGGPRKPGHEVVEAVLRHLEHVGLTGSPRLLGIDEHDRQVLEFLDGVAHDNPPWQHDDAENAAHLGRLAAWLRNLHAATANFGPPDGATPQRDRRRVRHDR